MAPKGSTKKNIQKRKPTSSQKLSQAEIEARLARRAKEIQDNVQRLEQSQTVTQDTMQLEFRV